MDLVELALANLFTRSYSCQLDSSSTAESWTSDATTIGGGEISSCIGSRWTETTRAQQTLFRAVVERLSFPQTSTYALFWKRRYRQVPYDRPAGDQSSEERRATLERRSTRHDFGRVPFCYVGGIGFVAHPSVIHLVDSCEVLPPRLAIHLFILPSEPNQYPQLLLTNVSH